MTSGITRYTKGAYNATAISDVYNKAKEIYIDEVVVPPPSSGIIPATTDIIWTDSMDPQGVNDVNPNMLSASYGQYGTPYQKTNTMTTILRTTAWNMFSEEGEDNVSCSLTINQAIDTVVEVGIKRTWVWKTDNTWVQIENLDFINGVHYPTINDNVPTELGCTEPFRTDRADNISYTCKEGRSLDGWETFRPAHSWWFHGYNNQINVSNVKAIFTQQYARLQLRDPLGNDDRHLAKYTFLVAVDNYTNNTYQGDLGMGKRKPVTNDWQSFNFLAMGSNSTTITQAEYEASNPPFSLVP